MGDDRRGNNNSVTIKLNQIISSLNPKETIACDKIRKISEDYNFYEMLTIESRNLCTDKIDILKRLCSYYSLFDSESNDQLFIKITEDFLININDRIIISFCRLEEMSAGDKQTLLKLLIKYKDINQLDDIPDFDDKSIYKEFSKGNGKHRLRFECYRNKAIEVFKENVMKNNSNDEDFGEKLKAMLACLTHNDKDRIIDVNYTIKNFQKYDPIIKNAVDFALSFLEGNIEIREFINLIEFALALYKNKFEEISMKKEKRKSKPPAAKAIKEQNPPRAVMWETVLNEVNVQDQWSIWNKSIEDNLDEVLNKPNFKNHQCPTPNDDKICDIVIGFESKSSLLYHFLKHNEFKTLNRFVRAAMDLIKQQTAKFEVRYSQSGNDRIYKITQEPYRGMACVSISNNGFASTLTFMPEYSKHIVMSYPEEFSQQSSSRQMD